MMNIPAIRKRTITIQILAVMTFIFLVQACAVNPVTNRMELMLVSEDTEQQIGQGVDKQVREEMGLYLEKPELTALVKETVEKLGRQSHRPDLAYQAEIVNTPDFNAFAVPGGFVYVHRGLLERINSVDELASVMGHEIAHVSARHSASQITKQQLLNIGVAGASIFAGDQIQRFGDLVNMGSVLAFSKFSRDDEREADYLGIRYMVDAGYNPEGAIDAMKTIQRISDHKPDSLEVWFMTHPPTGERVTALTHELNVLSSENPGILKRPVRRNELIRLLDGMEVGEYNGKEFVKDDRYYNREFTLTLPVPSGWQAHINSNDYTAVFSDSKNNAYAVFNTETLKNTLSTDAYFRAIVSNLESKGLKKDNRAGTGQKLAHGALSERFTGISGTAPMYVNFSAFVKDNRGYSFLEVREKSSTENVLTSMVNGLVFLPGDEISRIEPPRMKIHAFQKGETWDSIAAKYYKGGVERSKLAEYNGFAGNIMPLPGELLKIPPAQSLK